MPFTAPVANSVDWGFPTQSHRSPERFLCVRVLSVPRRRRPHAGADTNQVVPCATASPATFLPGLLFGRVARAPSDCLLSFAAAARPHRVALAQCPGRAAVYRSHPGDDVVVEPPHVEPFLVGLTGELPTQVVCRPPRLAATNSRSVGPRADRRCAPSHGTEGARASDATGSGAGAVATRHGGLAGRHRR